MFKLNTQKHYKIWFSKNKNIFLNIENQLRLIEMRDKNTDISISLIYSSKLLSEESINNMSIFCTKYKINIVDFDNELIHLLNDDNDKKLYQLAQQELQMLNEGGNPAAASDIVRWIKPVIKNYGIYSDFDVEINFNNLEKWIDIKFPLVLSVYVISDNNITRPIFNNEFIAVSTNLESLKINDNALRKISNVQNEIIRRYSNIKYALFYPLYLGEKQENDLYIRLIELLQENSRKISIYNIRSLIQRIDQKFIFYIFESINKRILYKMNLKLSDLETLKLQEIKEIHGKYIRKDTTASTKSNVDLSDEDLLIYKHYAYIKTVTHFSGPHAIIALYNYLEEQVVKYQEATITFKEEVENIISQINLSSIEGNNLSKNVLSNNQPIVKRNTQYSNEDIINNIGKFGDQSWVCIGELNVTKREEKMNLAASTIQKCWKEYIKRKKISNLIVKR